MALPLLLLLQLSAAASARHPAVSTGCAAELVAMAPCLSFVSAPPNAVASVPSDTCCDSFTFYAIRGGGGDNVSGATCLCHLVRDPLLFGFPLNASRISFLFGACSTTFATVPMTVAFRALCEATRVLPSFRDPSGANRSNSSSQSSPAGAPIPGTTSNGTSDATVDQTDMQHKPDMEEEQPSANQQGTFASSMTVVIGTFLSLLLVQR